MLFLLLTVYTYLNYFPVYVILEFRQLRFLLYCVAKCLLTFVGLHRKVRWRYTRRRGMLIHIVGQLSR